MTEKRREERVTASLPVILVDAGGSTCDVSASGVFFETDASLVVGETIDFTMEFDAPGGKRLLKCRGQVLRTEQRAECMGVAVMILDSAMTLVMELKSPVNQQGLGV